MLGKYRKYEQKFMKPFGRTLSKIFTANQISVLTLLFGLLSLYTYGFLRNPFYGALSILLAGFVDMLDGAVARETKPTKFGKILDPVMDRYSEFLILLGILMGGFSTSFWILICMVGMLMSSYVRARAESVTGMWTKAVGLAERQEKLLLLVAGSLIYYYFRPGLHYSVIVCALLSHFTVIQRMSYAKKLTGKN